MAGKQTQRPLVSASILALSSVVVLGGIAALVVWNIGNGEGPVFKAYANGVLMLTGVVLVILVALLAATLKQNYLLEEILERLSGKKRS
ncbi:MAG TPA: hypothetical protein VI432_02495 [Candidatus Paceibacterota bacterium]